MASQAASLSQRATFGGAPVRARTSRRATARAPQAATSMAKVRRNHGWELGRRWSAAIGKGEALATIGNRRNVDMTTPIIVVTGLAPPPVPERLRCLRKHLQREWTAQRARGWPRDTIAHDEWDVGPAPAAYRHGPLHCTPHPREWRLALAIASGDTATANGGVRLPRMILARRERRLLRAVTALLATDAPQALPGAPCGWTSSRGGGGGRNCGPSCDRVAIRTCRNRAGAALYRAASPSASNYARGWVYVWGTQCPTHPSHRPQLTVFTHAPAAPAIGRACVSLVQWIARWCLQPAADRAVGERWQRAASTH
jgi:hypothetical protein